MADFVKGALIGLHRILEIETIKEYHLILEEVYMDKLELIIKLTEMGYKAELIDGLPYIIGLNYQQTEKLVKELGYKGSYGIRKE